MHCDAPQKMRELIPVGNGYQPVANASSERIMRTIALVAAVALTACAARPSNPVAISRPGDDRMSCAELRQEREANKGAAVELAGADEGVVAGNIAAGVTGAVLFWPALFAMDLSNAEQIELRALQDRDKTLARLEEKKGCAASE
jgi:hypothetical protein